MTDSDSALKASPRPTRRPSAALAALLSAAALALLPPPAARAQSGAKPYDFYSHGPYRAAVPRPSAVLGYECGDTHTTFRDQERVIAAIAEAATDRVRVWEYGRSVEGRPLRLIAVSSPENLARLDEIRARIGKLADPRKLSGPAEADSIFRDTPTLTWINECIHGSETASFETGMWTLYTLAASDAPEVVDALNNSVVLLNPVFNPDGHERFVVYYNSVALGSPEGVAFEHGTPWGVSGRFNHYRFDMNRDKVAQSQPEVRQETREFLRWSPQVFIDQHGQPEVYFFPPNSREVNANADRARVAKWTDAFGRANGAAFDRYGWQYVTRQTYDLFYPGYLDSFTSLAGAVGMTYETDGGGDLARRRDDNTVSTLRDGAAHHLETALASVVTAAKNREGLLRDFYAFHKAAMTPDPKAEPLRAVVVLPGRDPNRARELAEHLTRLGVEVREAGAAFSSDKVHPYDPGDARVGPKPAKRSFPAGALVIDLAQPQGRLARALLEPDARFGADFVKEQLERRARNEKKGEGEPKEGYDFYDTTAWSLPLAYGLEAYWTEDAPTVAGSPLAMGEDGRVRLASSPKPAPVAPGAFAYLFPFDRDDAAVLALRLLQEGYRVSVAAKPMRAGGREWPRGTFVLRASRNPETLAKRLGELSAELNVPVTGVAGGYSDESNVGLGSEAVTSLRAPRIAVAADTPVDVTGYGSVWYLLDRAGIKFTAVPVRRLRGAADLARFNVIVLPDGGNYFGTLGKSGAGDLKEWAERGNALVGLGGGGRWFLEKDAGLSSAKVVGADEAEDGGGGDGSRAAEGDAGAKPAPPKKPISLPGALFRAQIDPTHPLGFGYPDGTLAVPLAGDTFLTRSTTGSNVVSFGKGPFRLSGFVWPDNTERLLADTAYVLAEPTGRGQAIYFLQDPTERAMWPGLRRLFLSALLFGPANAPFPPGAE